MATASAKATLDSLIQSAARIYRAVEPWLEAKEKVDFASNAAAKASRAAGGGGLSANDEHIEEARLKAHALSSMLGKLARKDENYWIERSPANLLQRATVPRAQRWLQQKADDFAALERAVAVQLPLVTALKSAFANPAVKGVRQVVLGPTTLHELDDWALQEIETSLKATSAHAKQIQGRLQNAKNGLVGWR